MSHTKRIEPVEYVKVATYHPLATVHEREISPYAPRLFCSSLSDASNCLLEGETATSHIASI